MANLSSTQDPSSPYFIHPSENPATPLVSEKFLVQALANGDEILIEEHAWDRYNDLIISYILRSLDSLIARSVLYLNTAREIWKDLDERYSQTSGPQFYTLQQNLYDLSQGSASVADFFSQIKALWDELSVVRPIPVCTCNGCTCHLTKKFLQQQQEERLI
uniref:Retrotransposon gag domain-containing protein n=1 Tax=Chenopodium quinoa TaxID=63459 RepID=A0A803N7R9_CHEQI